MLVENDLKDTAICVQAAPDETAGPVARSGRSNFLLESSLHVFFGDCSLGHSHPGVAGDISHVTLAG
ncbi:MAG: hypothetical protein QOK43_2367 [Acidimicrobiaceae bacterium]|nr:hypothetical protein [Acidimicrobiaceae bacterium]